MTKEALKLALEALVKKMSCDDDCKCSGQQAITAIKEALAQPEQEPVAFINVEQRKLEWAKYMAWDTPTVVNLPKIPLYTTPPQRKPLRDHEIAKILDRERMKWHKSPPTYEFDLAFARAIEAAHGIKGEA
jgi:hypothetical protein